MKLQILNKEGKKVKEVETKLFEEPVRVDIISKVVEAEKIKHPYSNTFLAGMNRSASGNVSHRRHVWKSDRGKGLSRIPRKASSRRGTNFAWEGAIIPSVRGGRRAHPPKGYIKLKKINKKEMQKAMLSSIHYVSDSKEIEKKYARIKDIKNNLPLVVENNFVKLPTKDFLDGLKNILGDLYSVAVKQKTVRSGKGKMRGRKYKQNAGVLFVIGNEENKSVNGIDIVNAGDLLVSDLAANGARLTVFSEGSIIELEKIFIYNKEKESSKKENSKNKMDKRKIKRENNRINIMNKKLTKNEGGKK